MLVAAELVVLDLVLVLVAVEVLVSLEDVVQALAVAEVVVVMVVAHQKADTRWHANDEQWQCWIWNFHFRIIIFHFIYLFNSYLNLHLNYSNSSNTNNQFCWEYQHTPNKHTHTPSLSLWMVEINSIDFLNTQLIDSFMIVEHVIKIQIECTWHHLWMTMIGKWAHLLLLIYINHYITNLFDKYTNIHPSSYEYETWMSNRSISTDNFFLILINAR